MTWELAWTKNITARTKTKVCTGEQKQGRWEWKEALWLDVLGFLLHSVQFSLYHPKLESFSSITSLNKRDRQPHTLTSAWLTNLESPVYLTCMSLVCGRKVEHMEETHTAVERARVHRHRAALVKNQHLWIYSLSLRARHSSTEWELSEKWPPQKSKQQQKVSQKERARRESWRCCMYS